MTEIPKFLYEMSEQLWTQDNRATAQPVYLVQELNTINSDDGELYEWRDEDWNLANETQAQQLDDGELDHEGWTKVNYVEYYETVQSFLTEKAAIEYEKSYAHRLNKPRIYVDSLYNNREMIQLREWIMSLTETERRR